MVRRAKSETVQLKVRMKEPLRAMLEKAADERGISMNTEAVDRLQRTFQNQKVLQEALDLSFGPSISGLLMVIGDVMRTTAQTVSFASTGDPSIENWSEDPLVFDEVAKAVATVLAESRPVGEIVPLSKKEAAERITAADIAQGIAIKRVAEIARNRKNPPLKNKGRD
jgi:hypothetical protein